MSECVMLIASAKILARKRLDSAALNKTLSSTVPPLKHHQRTKINKQCFLPPPYGF